VLRREPKPRHGFAAPLAVVLLIAIALLALLLIEGALGEVRASSAAYAESRLVSAAESALADALARRLDSTALSAAPATLLFETAGTAADSVVARVELVAPRVARIAVRARSRNPRVRVFAGVSALVALQASPTVTGEVILRPLAPNWWVGRP
jgi:Tfp pilus assembly protein PilX